MTKANSFKELKHIPGGQDGLPFLGSFIDFTTNTLPFFEAQRKKHGDVFKMSSPLGANVVICGPEANKLVLVDERQKISNQEAWEVAIGRLFPNGLMLMDGQRHKSHRSIILEAFKPVPMQGYLDALPQIFEDEFDTLKDKDHFLALPFFKSLTLKIAAKIFFGFDLSGELNKINKAITDVAMAATALPINVPGTNFRKGLQGRAYLENYFKTLLPERRRQEGSDLFSRLCHVQNEEGERLNDQEIVDHLIFVLMAAHDTTAITLSWMSTFLAQHKDWQDSVAREAADLLQEAPLKVADLRALESASLVLKETLRLHPPLILIPRFLREELEVCGHLIPANTRISLLLQLTQTDERVWTSAEAFDPARFTKERKEQNRCPFSYMPFGAGSHHCIGFGFAEMSTKLGISMLLKRFELSIDAGVVEHRAVPFKQPKKGPRILLNRRTH